MKASDLELPLLLMEEVLHHLAYIKPSKQWDIYRINWRISSINSRSLSKHILSDETNRLWGCFDAELAMLSSDLATWSRWRVYFKWYWNIYNTLSDLFGVPRLWIMISPGIFEVVTVYHLWGKFLTQKSWLPWYQKNQEVGSTLNRRRFKSPPMTPVKRQICLIFASSFFLSQKGDMRL